jgi:hypothetical protein
MTIPLIVLLVIAVTLLVLQPRVREHLSAANGIAVPMSTSTGPPYDTVYLTADVDQMVNLVPGAFERLVATQWAWYNAEYKSTPYTRIQLKQLIASWIAWIYSTIYSPATSQSALTKDVFAAKVYDWLMVEGGRRREMGTTQNSTIRGILVEIATAYYVTPFQAAAPRVDSPYYSQAGPDADAGTGIVAPGATKSGFYKSRYPPAEVERIAGLVPAAVDELYAARWGTPTAGGLQIYNRNEIRGVLSNVIAYLYDRIPKGTDSPAATTEDIEREVKEWTASDPDGKRTRSNDTIRAILARVGTAYFVPAPPAPTGTTGPTGPTGPSGATGPSPSAGPDGRIKVPRPTVGQYDSPYDPTETARILNLSSSAKTVVEYGYSDTLPPTPVTREQLVSTYLAKIVAHFYTKVYEPQLPVTLETIRDHVATEYASAGLANRDAYKDLLQRYYLRSGSVQRTESTFTELDTNNDDALNRTEFQEYVTTQTSGGGGGAGDGDAAGPTGGAAVTGEFERSLQEYRNASLQYKLTGNPGYKTQADGWKKWITEQIGDVRTAVTENATYIQNFVKQYETSDQDLVTLQSNLRDIRTKGPELQAQYETEKEAQKQEPVDFTPFYAKVGGLAALFAGVVGLSFFS